MFCNGSMFGIFFILLLGRSYLGQQSQPSRRELDFQKAKPSARDPQLKFVMY